MTITDSLRIAGWLIRLNRNRRWSRSQISHYQSEALIGILQHAVRTVPFYRSLGMDHHLIKTPDDLLKFPIMTKQIIQRQGDNLLSASCDKSTLYYSRTSGSSGEPTTTYFDRDCWLLSKYALKIHRLLGNGIGLFKNIVIISEQSPEQLNNVQHLAGAGLLFKQEFVSIHEPVAEHIPLLRDSGIDAIYAFPSYLDELIQHCKTEKISLPSVPVIFTSSEVLQPALRSRIEQFFHCRVCDVYGSTEFKEIAWQCPKGSYHLNFESVFVEPAPNDQAEDPDRSDVLITSLTNLAMPLIRFRIGDECALSLTPCGCGLQSATLSAIGGRSIDMVQLPGGRRISPYLLTTAVESHDQITQYQIVQTALDQVELRYVIRARNLSTNEVALIRSELQSWLGDTVETTVRNVPVINRSAAGKRQVFVQAMELDS